MTDYSRVETYLNSFVNYEVLPGFGFAEAGYDLSHVEELLRRLGNPHLGPVTVHIAGSKGKGSVAVMVARSLTACGIRTGLYTSPHLIDLGERVQVDASPATPWEMSEALDLVKPHLDAMAAERRWRRFTYFEVLTVVSFVHFGTCGIEAQVVEVGLGGRLDATNVVHPDVCVITPISLEHTAVLGDSISKIATEKAGIIKTGATVVSAPQAPEALRVIRDACGRKGTALVEIGRDVRFRVEERHLSGQTVVTSGEHGTRRIRLTLAGTYQAENAATAEASLRALEARGLALSDICVDEGMSAAAWPGRFQLLSREPLVVVDGAHNPASTKRLAESLDLPQVRPPLVFVVGFSSDKDVPSSVAQLSRLAGRFVFTKSAQPRATSPAEIAERVAGLGLECFCEPEPRRALERALKMAGSRGTVCVAGSLYLVADILRAWRDGTASHTTLSAAPSAQQLD